MENFNKTLKDFPEYTDIIVRYYSKDKEIVFTDIIPIPTKEIFMSGDYAMRCMSGIKNSLVLKYLKENKLYRQVWFGKITVEG